MKIKGELIGLPEPNIVIFQRGSKQFVFKAQAVLDYTEFDKLCPEPQPKVSMKPGTEVRTKVIDDEYKDRLNEWFDLRTNWTILESLKATEGLEWDTVDPGDPATWKGYAKELEDSGLITAEVNHIIRAVNEANLVDERKMREAIDRFRRSQEAPEPQS